MTDLGAMKLPADEHLDKDERWVRHLLEGTVGRTRVTDLNGARKAVMTLRQISQTAGLQR